MVCVNCLQNPVPVKSRKYCTSCASGASLRWKRAQRRKWKSIGQRYWVDNWKHLSDADRRAYFRNYMRLYRQKRRCRKLAGGR
jgi:hypothetical protein